MPAPSIRKVLNKPVVHILLLALMGLLAYSNTFEVPFQFDDKPNIVINPIIKDLRYFLETEKAKMFTGKNEYPAFTRRYIGHLTFALNYKIHGLDVTGYHVFNLFIHVLNAILLYWFVVLTFRTPKLKGSPLGDSSRPIALFAALLFVSHPMQTQAVTYIVQRLTSLATLFYMLSLVLYIKTRLKTEQQSSKTGAFLLYFFSVVSALLAMKTKEIAFTLPLVIALYECMFFRGKIKRRLIYLIPLLLTMLIIPLTYIGLYSGMDRPVGEMIHDADRATTIRDISRVDYLVTEFRVIVTYLRLLVLPVNQSVNYAPTLYRSFFDPQGPYEDFPR